MSEKQTYTPAPWVNRGPPEVSVALSKAERGR